MCVAERIKEWNSLGCCGAVVGATYPDDLKLIRKTLGDEIPILIPGIGAQGGDIKRTVKNGTNRKGEMAIINSSRSILYAGSDEKVREQTQVLRDDINRYR